MKRIVIIGASSGIGLQVAKRLAAMGWKIGVAARRTDPLIALKNQYRDNVAYNRIDINEADAPQKLLDLIDAIGGMDTLFLAAGIGWSNPELELDKDLKTIATNCTGFVKMVDTAYRYFADNRRKGQIAAITSVAATKGLGVSAAYSATKRFEQTYLQAISQLAAIDGAKITTTDIRPGFIRTDLLNQSRSYPLLMSLDYAAPKVVKAIVSERRVAYIDWRWRVVVGFWRLIPSWLWRKLKVNL